MFWDGVCSSGITVYKYAVSYGHEPYNLFYYAILFISLFWLLLRLDKTNGEAPKKIGIYLRHRHVSCRWHNCDWIAAMRAPSPIVHCCGSTCGSIALPDWCSPYSYSCSSTARRASRPTASGGPAGRSARERARASPARRPLAGPAVPRGRGLGLSAGPLLAGAEAGAGVSKIEREPAGRVTSIVRPRLVTKKAAASPAVTRVRKSAAPRPDDEASAAPADAERAAFRALQQHDADQRQGDHEVNDEQNGNHRRLSDRLGAQIFRASTPGAGPPPTAGRRRRSRLSRVQKWHPCPAATLLQRGALTSSMEHGTRTLIALFPSILTGGGTGG